MNTIVSTKEAHSVNGEYTKARLALHTDIITQYLVGEHMIDTPQATLLGGGSGAGKSSIAKITLKAYKDAGQDVVHIDSDDIKTKLPEYNEMVEIVEGVVVPKEGFEDWAELLHDESSDIADAILQVCVKERRNVIFDGTMKNYAKYKRILENLKVEGYHIEVDVVDVPIEEAIIRASKRATIDGRSLPDTLIIKSHQQVAETFYLLKELMENYRVWDNSGESPVVIAEKISNQETIFNPARLEQFFLKALDNFLKNAE